MTMTEPKRRFNFDPTINLGHVLTAVAMLGAGFGAYSSLDSRVTRVEERASHAEQARQETEQRTKETLSEIRGDVKEVQRSVNDVSRNLNLERARR
jgi:type VI protein secretion system component VasK